MQPEVIRLPIGTVSVGFDGLEVELVRYNLGWFPRDDSPLPAEDEVFTTFLVRVRNGAAGPRAVRPASFRYRTFAVAAGRGPTWDPSPGGRGPRLEEGMLAPGDEVEGWVTYVVPKGEIPDELLWSPSPEAAFAIYLPPVHSLSRTERALVFGRVTDAAGVSVPGAEVQVTAVDSDISGDPSQIGDCTGFPLFVEQAGTDPSGWYSAQLETIHSSQLCIDVQATAPSGSGLANARDGGGTVIPDQETPFAEAPEIRVDIVLPTAR